MPSHALASSAPALSRDLFLDGAWRPAASGKRIEVLDPATEAVIGTVADASAAEAAAAVDAADRASAAWAATAPRKRSEILMRAFARMHDRADELALLISRENGKALGDARGEVAYAAEFFRWYAEEAVRIPGELATAPGGANRMLVIHQPVGISLLVTPWNFPAAMATRKIGPALAAGCTCILKPATATPFTAYAIAEILAEAGVPAGVVNVLTTSRSGALVDAILADPRVRKLSFTGSTEVGRTLLHRAADRVLNVSMELGGNAPFLVFDDADLDAAVEGAMVAKMRNGGEACTAANRFYVHRTVYDAFAQKLAARMAALKMGPGSDAANALGPLVDAAGRDKVSALVDDAVKRGARVLTGGAPQPGKGFFYPPTVLVDVPADARTMREEIFGPVAPLVAFDTDDEAIALANGTEFGLVAYVFTRDLARGLKLCERVEAGMVALNRGLVSDPAAPFGGVKESGLGREGSRHGMMEYLEVKYIATSW